MRKKSVNMAVQYSKNLLDREYVELNGIAFGERSLESGKYP